MVKVKVLESERENRSRKRLILPLFLGAIMVMSVFGILIGGYNSGSDNSDAGLLQFGSYSFRKVPTGFVTTINGREAVFRFSPDELLEIDASQIPQDILRKDKVYLSRDPRQYYGVAERDLFTDVKPLINLQIACNVDIEECKNLPLKTCADADSAMTVILLQVDEKNEIASRRGCLIIKGDSVYITKVVDKLIYSYFGIS